MNSFDLFDTLVAGRNIKIAAGNQPGQYPIAENIAKVQAGDLIVSDYEHEQLAKKLVRETLGLWNQVIVTPDGKWTGAVWAKLPEKPKHHTGDNQRADVDSPQEHGIPATLSTLHKMTAAELFVYERIPQLALLMREARLRTFGQYRGIEIMQANYNFPVMFCASILLNRCYPGYTLLMSARDCFMWQRLMQKLFQRGVYWYTSCHARVHADENYHRYIRSFEKPLLVDLCGSGNSFSQIPQYPSLLMFTPEKSPWNVPALWRGPDVYRLEQANRAPHLKCMGVDENLKPVFLDRGVDCANEPHIAAQCETFFLAMDLLGYYDVQSMLFADDDTCLTIMKHLLPQYVNFARDVEALRLIDIREDA